MSVRIGVVGAGIMGADHVNHLHRFVRGATVAAVADIALDRAAAAADEVGARPYADALALIADPDVDAVVIASHDSAHAEQVLAAVRAGKPVLCEKPLAPTLDEAKHVQREIGTTGGQLLSLGFMRRFDPGYVQLRDAIDRGQIGAPVLVHNTSRGVSSALGATSEFSITGSAIHEFDVVPWLLRYATYGYVVRCEVVGETGTIGLTEPVRVVAEADLRRFIGYAADWRPRFADAYRLELQAWVDAVTSGRPTPLATGRDGVNASAVAEAVITSMHEGGRIVKVAAP